MKHQARLLQRRLLAIAAACLLVTACGGGGSGGGSFSSGGGQSSSISSGTQTSSGSTGTTTTTTDISGTKQFSIGGQITGLLPNDELDLLINGIETLKLKADGVFSFATLIAQNLGYAITIGLQPLWEYCSVQGGNGTAAADVKNVLVSCAAARAQVSTLAGSTTSGLVDGPGATALFAWPSGLAMNTSGILYVADSFTHRIRQITTSGLVTTVAGSGDQGSIDGTGLNASFGGGRFSLAADASGNVYMADSSNHEIRKMTPDYVVTTFAGSTKAGSNDGTGAAASFSNPLGLALDAGGNLYVADAVNHNIRKITPGGVVSTLAGSGVPSSADGTGRAAWFNAPGALAVDANGTVYVAEILGQKIRKITPDGVVTTLAGSDVQGSADGTGALASLNHPYGMAVDASGTLYVTDSGNNEIRRVTADGVVTTLAGNLTPGSANGIGSDASFSLPSGLTIDASGNLYIADMNNNEIRKITPIQ